MGLERLIIRSITKSVKSSIKFQGTVDDLISDFQKGCPPKERLIAIIKTKNQITSALQNINKTLNNLSSTASTIDNIISTLSLVVTTVKAIPIPTSVPPGVGLPLNVITILSNTLDTIGDALKKNKGLVKVIPGALRSITTSIDPVLTSLRALDGLIQVCITEAVEGMNEDEKNAFIDELNFSLTQTGDFSNPDLNALSNDLLLERLRPNSNNPLIYQNFKLEIQFNDQNEFSFPSRRVRGTNLVRSDIKLFNTDDAQYSYSVSTQILVEEAKFRIDSYLQRYPSLARIITSSALTGSVQDVNDPNINGGVGSGGGLIGSSSSTSGTPPPPDYTPFTTAGTVDGEVRFQGGQAWRWLGGSQKRWVQHTVSYAPFTRKGAYNGEVNTIATTNTFPRTVTYYKWNETLYKWVFDRTVVQ
jgi:hypothetical protein